MSFTNYHDGVQENAIIPLSGQWCPICKYDLRGTIAAGARRCPECGFKFTLDQLREMNVSNPNGEPASLAPGTWRIADPQMMVFLLGTVIFNVIVMSLFLALA